MHKGPDEVKKMNFVEKLKELREIKDDCSWFMRYSDIFKALRKYIEHTCGRAFLDIPNDAITISHKGSSGVTFRDPFLCSQEDYFGVYLKVEFSTEDEIYGPREKNGHNTIYIPVSLLGEFDKKKFDTWIKEVEKEKKTEREKEERVLYKKLHAKFGKKRMKNE